MSNTANLKNDYKERIVPHFDEGFQLQFCYAGSGFEKNRD